MFRIQRDASVKEDGMSWPVLIGGGIGLVLAGILFDDSPAQSVGIALLVIGLAVIVGGAP